MKKCRFGKSFQKICFAIHCKVEGSFQTAFNAHESGNVCLIRVGKKSVWACNTADDDGTPFSNPWPAPYASGPHFFSPPK